MCQDARLKTQVQELKTKTYFQFFQHITTFIDYYLTLDCDYELIFFRKIIINFETAKIFSDCIKLNVALMQFYFKLVNESQNQSYSKNDNIG